MDFKKQLSLKLLIAFLIIGAAVTAVEITVGDLGARSRKIVEQKNELALRTQATGFLADLKSDFEKAKPLLSLLKNALPEKDDFINLSREMADLGKRFNLEMSFVFGSENAGKDGLPASISFSLTGTGSYDNLIRFFKEVEKSPFYIKFGTVDLTKKAGGDDFGFVIDAEIFHQ